MSVVLVVAAHPDDEVLGCGGTIARHVDQGDTVHILIVAEGATSRDAVRDASARGQEISALAAAARQAAAVLGAQPPIFCGLPDNRLDQLPLLDVVKVIQEVVDAVQPSIVYTHHAGDLNVDHRVLCQAVATVCRPLPGAAVRSIYHFEVQSSTEWGAAAISVPFNPCRFVDVSTTLDRKLAALDCYASEMRPFPHARSLQAAEALARLRGSQVGCHAAEAFMVAMEVR